ncbi:hypothetical protein C8J55DRAFT_104846 [Lentinula edodes]|uniref:Thioredoxin domain-containing protein n=1 Tax=Lentinula lateritia TaxID=40482 RepID=A0A9W9B1W3_9AGAR|nr:hypothetical protein C8J55DRAFT_104846 [Lentinula edodes]
MTTFVTCSSSTTHHTTMHKIRRKPAPTLLSPITPITPLRAPNVTPAGSLPKETSNSAKPSVIPASTSNPSNTSMKQALVIHTRTASTSTSLFTDHRYPPPDPSDPFAPLSVLRDRSRRCSTNAFLSSSYTFAAGSDDTGHLKGKKVGMASSDNLSVASSTKSSFMPVKGAKKLGVIRTFPNDFIKEKKRSKHPQERISMCSVELHPDPLSSHVLDKKEDGVFGVLETPKKRSITPCPSHHESKVSTPTQFGTLGHYTPHSRQRTRSSFSALSSPSPTFKLSNRKQHVLIPAPDAHPLPSLVRDRSESSVSGSSSSGTGYPNYGGNTGEPTSTPERALPPASASNLSLGGPNASHLDISDSYALTMALLSSPQKHPYARSDAYARSQSSSSSRDSSPCRSDYGKGVKSEQTPKAARTKKIDIGDSERPTSPMFKLARFFTGGKVISRKNSIGSLKILDGITSPKIEKRKANSPPSRGRARSRKLSVSSINISGPVAAPVSIPLGSDICHRVTAFPPNERSANRPRSQTTSGLPPSTFPGRLHPSPYRPETSCKSSVSVSATGITAAVPAHVNEFDISRDQGVEDEVNKELNLSLLKPWTASIPRKRSSLSLSVLPTFMSSEGGETEIVSTSNLPDTSGFATSEPRKNKGSSESAVSAGSMGSSYIHVVDSCGETFVKHEPVLKREEDFTRTGPRRAPLPPRSKTEGLLRPTSNHGIAGIKFPRFRRAQSSVQDPIQGTAFPSTPGSVRGLKISSPMLQTTVSSNVKLDSPIALPSSASLGPPVMQSPAKGHEWAISDSSCTFLNHSPPMKTKVSEVDDAVLSPPLPTPSELQTLLALPLLDEHGQEAKFGDILNDPAAVNNDKAVIVLFIRHFWCPLDQDYVQEVGDILRRLSKDKDGWQLATSNGELRIGDEEGNEAGKKAIPEVIIISNGSPALIAKYKEIFDLEGEKGSNLKVKMYTDPTCRTYGVLGMENVGEACISVVSTTSTPIPPALKHSSTISSPPDSLTSRRGRGGITPYRYDTEVPLARIDYRKAPPTENIKGSPPPSASANIDSRSCPDPPSPSAMLSALETSEPALARSVSPLSINSTHASASRSYVKHTSVIGGIATVVVRAIRVGMPVWEKGGAIKQLGGELVFRVMKERLYDQETGRDPEMQVACVFAHRMRDTQDHTPFGDVLKIALTASPSNDFVSFCPTAACVTPSSITHPAYSLRRSSKVMYSPYECSTPPLRGYQTASSAPCSPSKPSRRRTQTDVYTTHTSTAGTAWWVAPTDEGEEVLSDESPEDERVMHDSVLDTLKDGPVCSWGDKLHTLRTRVAQDGNRNVSGSVRGIKARDSICSSTGTATDTLIRAIRAKRVPRGPRMRMQSVSAESLTASRSRDTVKSFGSGMECIESVMEYGESISSPDLSIFGQLAIGAGGPSENRWKRRRATDSTSTLNSSLYYDAHEGLLEINDNGEEEISRSVAVGVVPIASRPPSRLWREENVDCSESQDQTFDSLQSYDTSADRTDQLTSLCSETSDDDYEENAEKLRELLVIRASGSIRGRGI